MTLPAPSPVIEADTAEFWIATSEGRLLLKQCTACHECFWYPRRKCPFCHCFETEWVQASGKGEIYSFTVTTKGLGDFANTGTYALAYVELDEGPRIMTNIVDTELESLHIGQRVEVTFHPTESGVALPRFRPVDGAQAHTTAASA
jgi:uncharacterized OB-fold protein